MEVSVISDAVSTVIYSAGLSNFLLNRHHLLCLSDTSSDQSPPSSAAALHISAAAPPLTKTLPKRILRKTRRLKRKTLTGDDGEANGFWFLIDGGDFSGNGGDGSFGGGGSGGRGWNFDGFGGGGSNWEEESSNNNNNSLDDPAFDVVYEALCWIALSNCLHFAFKRVVRIVAGGIGDPAREKVPVGSVC